MPDIKRTVILGVTGSIGTSAVAEVKYHSDKFKVVGVAANNSIKELAAIARELGCDTAVTGSKERVRDLEKELENSEIQVAGGDEGLVSLVERDDVDIVLCAIIGVAGIHPVISALRKGKTVALASKEVLCLAGRESREISSLCLTASGGPFRTWSREAIANATCADALKHPTWSMGRKITIDSATLMNKALEVIEASYLFGVPHDRIKAVINPSSIVHAFIELTDGSIISQMSTPDMRLAIRYALSYPERLAGDVPALDLGKLGKLEFEDIDNEKFPSIELARTALAMGGSAPCVLNAANDVAVARFMRNEIRLPDIWKIIRQVLESHVVEHPDNLERILEIDAEARLAAEAVEP